MCTGKCSKVIAVSLYVLALVSIVCNIMMFFPDWSTEFVEENSEEMPRLTDEVTLMGGVVGGGIAVLIPAIHIHLTSSKGCCANRCGMFLSIGFAAAGVLGSLYSLSTAAVGLANGPRCQWSNLPDNPLLKWGRPFMNSTGSYLSDSAMWEWCKKPENVVEFNVVLFSILMVAASLELLLCGIQMVNGLFGCLCGTCGAKE